MIGFRMVGAGLLGGNRMEHDEDVACVRMWEEEGEFESSEAQGIKNNFIARLEQVHWPIIPLRSKAHFGCF